MLSRARSRSALAVGLVAAYCGQQVAAIQLWSAPAAIPTSVPLRCRAVLVQNITCPNSLVTAPQVASGLALSDADAAAYCTTACYDSLKSFQAKVTAGCGTTMYTLFINSTYTQSAAALADSLVWAYGVSCIKDSSGFCLSGLYAGTKAACSDCSLKYGAAMLSSDYGRDKISPDAFSSLLSSCSANPSSYTYTYTSTSTTATGTVTTTAAASPTCTGQTYTVKPGDTCPSVSKDQGVGTDLMVNRNKLDYNCTVLSPGMSLCLQDKCTIKTLDRNYTCAELTRDQPFGLVQLLSWNPSIHSNCDNLDSMIGRSICLSPPGGGTFGGNLTATHEPNPTLTNPLFSTWISAAPADTAAPNFTTSWYTPTLDRSATPSLTTTASFNETLASELAQQTQYCWLNDDDWNNGFDVEEFPSGCQSLLDVYCFPTPGEPVPTSPTRIPAVCTPNRATYITDVPSTTTNAPRATPTPYQPNMVRGCQEFYKVVTGDDCQSVASKFSITWAQLYSWNPDVGENCQALFRGYYVCVGV